MKNNKHTTHKKTNSALTFILGCGSSIDISGKYFSPRYKSFINTSDSSAIRGDWSKIGQDLTSSYKTLISNKT